MGLFDMFSNKNKKSFGVGTFGTFPTVEVDLENRQVRVSPSMTEFMMFSLDQLTDMRVGAKSMTVWTLSVYINGIMTWQCEGTIDPKRVAEAMAFIKKSKASETKAG